MNVDFLVEQPTSFITTHCTYCDESLVNERFVRIKFDTTKAINLHDDECWNNFVVGVKLINEQLMKLSQN